MVMIDCPWCGGAGRFPCEAPWCADMSHDTNCYICNGDGELPVTQRGATGRWLVRVPTWLVPTKEVRHDH